MLLAEDGMWEFFRGFSQQAPGIAALLIAFAIAFGMFLFFLWKLIIRYGDQGMSAARAFITHLSFTNSKIDALVNSNECIPGLASDVKKVATKVEKVADKLEEWPSDAPTCQASGGCKVLDLKPYITEISDEVRKLAGNLSDAQIIDVIAFKRAEAARQKSLNTETH